MRRPNVDGRIIGGGLSVAGPATVAPMSAAPRSAPFRATVRQVYRLTDTQLVVLKEDYEGDVGPGDEIELQLREGTAKAKVVDLAWGSAFQANEPPLTLIVKGLPEGAEPGEEAWLKTVFE